MNLVLRLHHQTHGLLKRNNNQNPRGSLTSVLCSARSVFFQLPLVEKKPPKQTKKKIKNIKEPEEYSCKKISPPIRAELQLFYTNFVLNQVHTFPLASPQDKLLCLSILIDRKFLKQDTCSGDDGVPAIKELRFSK